MEIYSLMNKIIFSFIFSKTKVFSFLRFSSFFENYFLRLFLITFDLLYEILSLSTELEKKICFGY